MSALPHSGQEQFPDAAGDKLPHWINPAIPAIEITDDTHALRVRCPDREVNTFVATNRPQMRAELLVETMIVSLREQMQIELAHDQAVAIRIADCRGGSVPAREMNPVIAGPPHSWKGGLKKTFGPKTIRRETLIADNNRGFLCVGPKNPNDEIV